jgi:hypothetical protein
LGTAGHKLQRLDKDRQLCTKGTMLMNSKPDSDGFPALVLARTAGIATLGGIVMGAFAIGYVPSKLNWQLPDRMISVAKRGSQVNWSRLSMRKM